MHTHHALSRDCSLPPRCRVAVAPTPPGNRSSSPRWGERPNGGFSVHIDSVRAGPTRFVERESAKDCGP
jgi:hypothetical protein